MNLDLYTDRLLLRPLRLDDLDLCIEMFTVAEVIRYIGELETAENIERDMPKYIKRCAGGCIGVWCIFDKNSDERLGTTALVPMPINLDDTDWDLIEGPDIPGGDIEIGYILRKPAWGKGIASEAASRLLRFAFEDTPLSEVVATLDDGNLNSRHVLEKIGMREMGKRRTYAEDGCADFRITREHWQELQ